MNPVHVPIHGNNIQTSPNDHFSTGDNVPNPTSTTRFNYPNETYPSYYPNGKFCPHPQPVVSGMVDPVSRSVRI